MDIVAPINEFWASVTTIWGFTNAFTGGVLWPAVKYGLGVWVGLLVLGRCAEAV